jgi:hypothetical protein
LGGQVHFLFDFESVFSGGFGLGRNADSWAVEENGIWVGCAFAELCDLVVFEMWVC